MLIKKCKDIRDDEQTAGGGPGPQSAGMMEPGLACLQGHPRTAEIPRGPLSGGGAQSPPQGVGQSPALSFEAKICAFIQEACMEHLLSETTLVIGVHQ